jgi:hypothetical protein
LLIAPPKLRKSVFQFVVFLACENTLSTANAIQNGLFNFIFVIAKYLARQHLLRWVIG